MNWKISSVIGERRSYDAALDGQITAELLALDEETENLLREIVRG